MADPLFQLLDKGQNFTRTPPREKAFLQLKSCLMAPPALAFPLPNTSFILDTDASLTDVGAALSQMRDGEERIIAHFNGAFRATVVKSPTVAQAGRRRVVPVLRPVCFTEGTMHTYEKYVPGVRRWSTVRKSGP